MTKVKIRKAYDDHDRVVKSCGDDVMTQQHFAAECDINNIMKKFERDRLMDHVNSVEGQYGDYGEVGTFHEAMNTVREAQEMFETVPAALRARFGNDPGAFLDWTQTASEDDLRAEGLLPPASVDPAPVEPPSELGEPPDGSPADPGPATT